MGKRRIRNLLALGHTNIVGFDPRDDRRKEVLLKYKIATYVDFDLALRDFDPDVLVISTPPNLHMHYAQIGFKNRINCFIEASVVESEKIKELGFMNENSDIVIVPSCTMRYAEGPKKIKELVKSGNIGRILNINYQTGQYLPDWHPWEKVEDFYVSHRETGGAREIVSFELTWLNDIFGTPIPINCYKTNLTGMNSGIDDIYHFLLLYDHGVLANITIEVISRPKAVRELSILGSEGRITFSGETNLVRCIRAGSADWENFQLNVGTLETGYINSEEPYIAEMKDFISAVIAKDSGLFPNSLENDFQVLQTLYSLEKLSDGEK
jgi:predicted dehydrogenase